MEAWETRRHADGGGVGRKACGGRADGGRKDVSRWRAGAMAAHGGDNNFGSDEKTLAKSACML